MNGLKVKAVFDSAAGSYDRARRQLVPCFDDFYGTVLGLIPYNPEDAFRLLDLGAGTGLLSALVAERFPKAHLTLVDLSEAMLDKARERLSNHRERLSCIAADYSTGFDGSFAVAISALSIHHLEDARKISLYKRIHGSLTDGGIFINADQVLGPTPEIEKTYQTTWLRQARELGVSDEDLHAALERMREDRMASLDDQLTWLRQAGFTTVHCWYQHHRFAVFSGRKG
ncbi:MAG: class I SAM-dependent methyltransferase [Thermodesulfobacteriota bacterium]